MKKLLNQLTRCLPALALVLSVLALAAGGTALGLNLYERSRGDSEAALTPPANYIFSKPGPPMVKFSDIKLTPSVIKPNETITFTITVQNITNWDTFHYEIFLFDGGPNITLEQIGDIKHNFLLNGQSTTETFSFTSSKVGEHRLYISPFVFKVGSGYVSPDWGQPKDVIFSPSGGAQMLFTVRQP